MNRLFEAEAFLLVVEEGSFTGAAQRLGVTKSYASKLVSHLEDRLGVRLLARTTRKLTLTEPGRSYYERCTGLIKTLEQAEAEAAALTNTPRGRLRLALPHDFGALYLARPLAEFKARYPDLTIEAAFSDERVDLVAEGFDLAIRAGDLSDTSEIARRLAVSDKFLCASESYLAKRGIPAEPEELVQHECLLYAYHAAPRTWALNGPRGRVAVDVSGSLISNSGRVLVEAACAGLGIVFMPEFLTGPCLRDARLRRVLPSWKARAGVFAVTANARHSPAKVTLFVDFLAEKLRKPPWTCPPSQKSPTVTPSRSGESA